MLNALMGLLGAGYFAPPPVVKVNSNSNYSQNSNSSGSHSGTVNVIKKRFLFIYKCSGFVVQYSLVIPIRACCCQQDIRQQEAVKPVF